MKSKTCRLFGREKLVHKFFGGRKSIVVTIKEGSVEGESCDGNYMHATQFREVGVGINSPQKEVHFNMIDEGALKMIPHRTTHGIGVHEGALKTEVNFLGQLRHPSLVKLIGYCCEDVSFSSNCRVPADRWRLGFIAKCTGKHKTSVNRA